MRTRLRTSGLRSYCACSSRIRPKRSTDLPATAETINCRCSDSVRRALLNRRDRRAQRADLNGAMKPAFGRFHQTRHGPGSRAQYYHAGPDLPGRFFTRPRLLQIRMLLEWSRARSGAVISSCLLPPTPDDELSINTHV